MPLRKIESAVVPKTEGRGFRVRAGQILRVVQIEGGQVCDFNAWSAENPREYFWAGRTRIIERAHLTTGSRLWSVEPWMRVMFTIREDTAPRTPSARGARFHDLFYPRCNRRFHQLFFGEHDRPNCHMNLTRVAAEFGIGEELVHDTLNLFMKTGIDADDRIFAEEPDSRQGDYVDLEAHIDCLVAISACPGHTSPVLRSLGIEIYEPA